jgi:ribokinase
MMRPKIVVVGSLNMDLVVTMERMPKSGETIQGQQIHYIPGGKGANQAIAI